MDKIGLEMIECSLRAWIIVNGMAVQVKGL